ncbi:hypothetical protein D3C76_1637580 [compost metagenome]
MPILTSTSNLSSAGIARCSIEFGQGQVAVEQRGQALVVADEQKARPRVPAFGEQQAYECFAGIGVEG